MFGVDKFITRKAVAYAVRRGLLLAGTYLVSEGWVEGEVWTMILPGLSLALADFALSMIDKAKARKAVKVALAMPEGSTEKDLKVALKAA